MAGFQAPEAPTFRPTAEEFSNPFLYISSIRLKAEAFGICRIIPPAGWKPPFAIDRHSFRFKTRIQPVHELQHQGAASAAGREWQEGYQAFLRRHGKQPKKAPTMGKQEIDLWKLFRAVAKRGGYERVTQEKAWKDICRVMRVDEAGNAPHTLRLAYQRHLLAYEEDCSKDAAAAHPAEKGSGSSRKSKGKGTKRPLPQDDATQAAQILEAMLGSSGGMGRLNVAPGAADRANSGDAASQLKLRRKRRAKGDSRAPRDLAGMSGIRIPQNIMTLNCELCKGGHHEEKIILCDRCDRGYHYFCLSPPLSDVPAGDWVCPLCVAEEAHAFREGKEYTLEEFRVVADEFKHDYFGGKERAEQVMPDDVEAAFWKVVESSDEPVEVLYGADLDTGVVGSGFPCKETSDSPYARDGWNLNNFPRLGGTYGSMLRHIDENIAGVVVPWLYVGMMFSSFCWHIEDHMFYSINYHHWGDPKQWYGVPGSAAYLFEAAFKQALPGKFEKQPDLLFHLVTMLSPKLLHQHGVPVYRALQEEGQFMVTFPCAYHGGFNQGFNCAEAVNFAPADWLRFGAASTERYRSFRKPSVVSHEQLLMKVAQTDPSPETCFWVRQELQRILQEETEWRCRLWARGVRQARRVTGPKGFEPEEKDEAECAICHLYLHVSGLECNCCPGRRVCLQHADNLCECEAASWRLAFRYSLADLQAVLAEVASHIPGEAAETPDMQQLLQGEQATAAGTPAGPPVEHPAPDVKMESDDEASEADVKPLNSALATNMALSPGSRRKRAASQIVDHNRASDVENDSADDLSELTKPGKASKAAKRRRVTPVRSYPTRERTKADAEAGAAEADVLDAFSALAQLAEVAGDPDQAADGSHSPGRKSSDENMSPANGHAPAAAGDASSSHARASSVEDLVLIKRRVQGWLDQLKEQEAVWLAKATHVLQHGGITPKGLEELLADAEQYLWGEGDGAAVQQAQLQLQDCNDWADRVAKCLRQKATVEVLEPLVSRQPLPCDIPGYSKLLEAHASGRQWLHQAATALAEEGTVDLSCLEKLCEDASSVSAALPQAKELRERMAAARKVAQSVRSMLPHSPTSGENGDLEEADADEMRALQEQSEHLRVEMPELATLNEAVGKLDSFQSKAQECLKGKAQLADLEALQEEAEKLPAWVPEVKRINTLVQKAHDWLAKSGSMTSTRAPLKRMRDLLHSGTRLAVVVPEVEALRHEIRKREWCDAVKKALNVKSSLATLEALLEEAPETAEDDDAEPALLEGLKERVESAQEFYRRAKAIMERVEAAPAADGDQAVEQAVIAQQQPAAVQSAPGAAPATAEALLQQQQDAFAGTSDPAERPSCFAGAAHPEATAQAAAPQGAEQQLAVDMLTGAEPQQQPGAKVQQQGRPSLEQLAELLDEGADLSVKFDMLPQLVSLLEAAHAWVEQAELCLQLADEQQQRHQREQDALTMRRQQLDNQGQDSDEDSEDDPSARRRSRGKRRDSAVLRPTLAAVEDLLAELPSLGLRIPEADALQAKQHVAREWVVRCRQAQQQPITEARLPELQTLVEAGAAIGLQMAELDRLQAEVGAVHWTATVGKALAALEAHQAGSRHPGSAGPSQAWQEPEARPAAAGPSGAQAPAGPEVADIMPAPWPEAVPQQQQQAPSAELASNPVPHLAAAEPPGSATSPLLSSAETPPAWASAPPAVQPAAQQPPAQRPACQLSAAAGLAEHQQPGPEPSGPAATAPLLLDLHNAASLVKQGRKLPVDSGLLEQLTVLVVQAEEWEEQVGQILGDVTVHGTPPPDASSAEMRRLISEGQAIQLHLPSLGKLEAALEGQQIWEERLEHILEGTVKPTYLELVELQTRGVPPARSANCQALLEQVDVVVAEAEAWLSKATRRIAKGRGSHSLEALLEHMGISVRSAQVQMEAQLRKVQEVKTRAAQKGETGDALMALERRRKPPPAGVPLGAMVTPAAQQQSQQPGAQQPPGQQQQVPVGGVQTHTVVVADTPLPGSSAQPQPPHQEEDAEPELYCVCQQSVTAEHAMLCCDSCFDWYHLRCVGLTPSAGKSSKRYTCPVCAALKGHNSDVLEHALSKNRRTCWPSRDDLAAMCVEAQKLPCTIPEHLQMMRVLSAFDRWLSSVETIAKGHEASVRIASQGHHAAAVAARLPESTLTQMLKSALSVEVNTEVVSMRLLRCIKADRWRQRGGSMLRSTGKQTVDILQKALKEGEQAEIVMDQDPIGSVLQQRAQAGKRWTDAAKNLMQDLKDHATEYDYVVRRITEAHGLIRQAAGIDVRLDREVAKLEEAATIYCICRQPYDESRPMLSCDHCEDWFHYDCIGLHPPRDDQLDADVAPSQLRCPKCCLVLHSSNCRLVREVLVVLRASQSLDLPAACCLQHLPQLGLKPAFCTSTLIACVPQAGLPYVLQDSLSPHSLLHLERLAYEMGIIQHAPYQPPYPQGDLGQGAAAPAMLPQHQTQYLQQPGTGVQLQQLPAGDHTHYGLGGMGGQPAAAHQEVLKQVHAQQPSVGSQALLPESSGYAAAQLGMPPAHHQQQAAPQHPQPLPPHAVQQSSSGAPAGAEGNPWILQALASQPSRPPPGHAAWSSEATPAPASVPGTSTAGPQQQPAPQQGHGYPILGGQGQDGVPGGAGGGDPAVLTSQQPPQQGHGYAFPEGAGQGGPAMLDSQQPPPQGWEQGWEQGGESLSAHQGVPPAAPLPPGGEQQPLPAQPQAAQQEELHRWPPAGTGGQPAHLPVGMEAARQQQRAVPAPVESVQHPGSAPPVAGSASAPGAATLDFVADMCLDDAALPELPSLPDQLPT